MLESCRELENRTENISCAGWHFSCRLRSAVGRPENSAGHPGGLSPAPVVRAEPHVGLRSARPLYCRSHHHVFVPGLGNALSGTKIQSSHGIRHRISIGLCPGGMLMQRPAHVCGHLPARRRSRAGLGLPVFGACHKRACYFFERPCSGFIRWSWTGCWRHSFRSGHRPADGDSVSQRRAGKGRNCPPDART